MRLLAISGSLRRGSYNARAARRRRGRTPDRRRARGLARARRRPCRTTRTSTSRRRRGRSLRLRAEIEQADAILIATPEYNASVPGALKNALDWVSRPFPANPLRHKPVAVIGASTGLFGAVWAQAELRKVLSTMGASVLEAGLSVSGAQSAFTAEGRLREPELALDLRRIVYELLEETVERAA